MANNSTKSPKKQRTVQITKTQVLLQRNKRLHVVVAAFIVLFIAIAGYAGWRVMKVNVNKGRLNEVIAIYDGLKLDDSYNSLHANIFGDKRVYEWDKGRTYSSEVEYFHNATPLDTRADLRKKAEAEGFTFVQTEYGESIQPIDEYKNSKGNYIRVSVMSQPTYESLFLYRNFSADNPLIDHKDEAPTHIVIKVNLDDNNE